MMRVLLKMEGTIIEINSPDELPNYYKENNWVLRRSYSGKGYDYVTVPSGDIVFIEQ